MPNLLPLECPLIDCGAIHARDGRVVLSHWEVLWELMREQGREAASVGEQAREVCQQRVQAQVLLFGQRSHHEDTSTFWNNIEVSFLVLNGCNALIWHGHYLHNAILHVDLCNAFKELPLPQSVQPDVPRFGDRYN